VSYGSREAKTVVTPGAVLPGGLVFEQIDVDGSVQYAVKYPNSQEIKVQPFLKVSEHVIYQPLSPCPWTLPPPPIDYGSVEKLWSRTRDFAYDHIDFEYDVQYDVYVAWVLADWTPERWDSVPYLWFTGAPKSGKTRCLDVLSYIAYRPLLSPSVSAASIYRALDSFHPTFLLDEFEMYQKIRELKAEVIGILNAGYRRGQYVLRTDKVKDGAPILRGFSCFGFKAITSIEELPPALKTRVITFVMTKAVRKIRRLIDKEAARELRGMLLKYRFDFCTAQPPSGNPIDLPDGRLIELYTPLVTVAPKDKEEKILEYARSQYAGEIEEERRTLEAKVFMAFVDLLVENPRARIPQADIRAKVNARLPENEQLSPTKLGKILGNRLGFQSKTGKNRLQEVVVDPSLILRRAKRYIEEGSEDMNRLIEALKKLKSLAREGKPKNLKEALETIKVWLVENRDSEGLVDAEALSRKINGMGLDVKKVIQLLKDEYVIMDSPELGKFIVK